MYSQKALLKVPTFLKYIQHASEYGIQVKEAAPDMTAIVKRSGKLQRG